MRETSTMRKFSLLFPAMALAAGLAGISAPAHAAGALVGNFNGFAATLTPKDWAAFKTAALKLLDEAPATPGETQKWQGPSGASGTLALQHVYEKSNMPCRDVSAYFNAKNATGGQSYNLSVCKDTAGDWKIVS